MAFKYKTICSNQGCEKLAYGDITDKDYITVECDDHHINNIYTDLPHYVFLFEHSLVAYKEENYFESFTAAYSALENLWRSVVYAYSWRATGSNFKTYALIKQSGALKLSERYHGAFDVIYTIIFNKAPSKKQSNLSSIRNKIIHGAKIPNEENCKELIEYVYKLASEIELNWIDDTSSGRGFMPLILNYYILHIGNIRMESPETQSLLKKAQTDQTPSVELFNSMLVHGDGTYTLLNHNLFGTQEALDAERERRQSKTVQQLISESTKINL